MPRAILSAALLVAVAAATGCSRSDPWPASAVTPRAQAAVPTPTSRPKLLFFMNPNGRPCQLQDAVLRAMPDLTSRADLVTYRTTEPADLPRFAQFGVRALPLLVVADSSGVEVRRATPGILSDPQVRQLLAP